MTKKLLGLSARRGDKEAASQISAACNTCKLATVVEANMADLRLRRIT